MNEGNVKDEVKELLDRKKAYYFMPIPMHNAGVPDIISCVPIKITDKMIGKTIGAFVGIETKYGRGDVTGLQHDHLSRILAAGGEALVVDEKGIRDFDPDDVSKYTVED